MSFRERMKRRDHLRETVERARRYHREHGRGAHPSSAVCSACGTMLFDPTDEERAEMIRMVSASGR